MKPDAANACDYKDQELDPSKAGTYVPGRRGGLNLKITKAACLASLWENALVSTRDGRLCMLAAIRAIVIKWADLTDFFVPVTVHNR